MRKWFEPIATADMLSNTNNTGGCDYSTSLIILHESQPYYLIPWFFVPYIINNNEVPICMTMDKAYVSIASSFNIVT